MPRTFAYVRVSTIGQTTENQIREIEAAGFAIEPRRVQALALIARHRPSLPRTPPCASVAISAPLRSEELEDKQKGKKPPEFYGSISDRNLML